jgi:hypothetical protein
MNILLGVAGSLTAGFAGSADIDLHSAARIHAATVICQLN